MVLRQEKRRPVQSVGRKFLPVRCPPLPTLLPQSVDKALAREPIGDTLKAIHHGPRHPARSTGGLRFPVVSPGTSGTERIEVVCKPHSPSLRGGVLHQPSIRASSAELEATTFWNQNRGRRKTGTGCVACVHTSASERLPLPAGGRSGLEATFRSFPPVPQSLILMPYLSSSRLADRGVFGSSAMILFSRPALVGISISRFPAEED